MYPPSISPAQARQRAKHFRRIMNAVARANAPGKDDRIAAAQAKRDRKNVKRKADKYRGMNPVFMDRLSELYEQTASGIVKRTLTV